MGGDNWDEWSKYVLEGMKSLKAGQKELGKELAKLGSKIAEKDAKQDKEWASVRNELEHRITGVKEKVASNSEAIDGHKWLLRAIMGITVLAALGGITSTVNSCVVSNGQSSDRRSEVITEEVVWVDQIDDEDN